jgi:hypothetical protein
MPVPRRRALDLQQAEGAAVSFCQRFGSSLNLNVHRHGIVPDAVFLPDATGEHASSTALRPPTRLDLEESVIAVALRSVRWLDQHGYVRCEGEQDTAEDAEAEPTTDPRSPGAEAEQRPRFQSPLWCHAIAGVARRQDAARVVG